MREDTRVDFLVAAVILAAFFAALPAAFRSGADSLNWELRWQGLGPEDRARISAAARSHEKLDDPEEAELASGLRRRDQRRNAYVELVLLPFPLAAIALSLTGVLDSGIASFVLGLVAIASGLGAYLRRRYMDGTPRPATAPEAGL
jgi:hypothetical protein